MRVLRQASEESLQRAVRSFAALALALFAAGCSGGSDGESRTAPSAAVQDAAACESTSQNAPCSPAVEDEPADDQELNRDELERELDRIEQEITAP